MGECGHLATTMDPERIKNLAADFLKRRHLPADVIGPAPAPLLREWAGEGEA